MRVVVAPDKFKGGLTAVQAAEAIGEGLRQGSAEVDVVLAPVADGGDGTVDAAVAAGYDRVTTTATGPTGEPVTASFAVSDDTAVVEMAEAAGLRRLPGSRPAPLTATTYGVGELMRAALDRRVTRVVLGVGGSATTDGGTGMARALGVRFLDAEGRAAGGTAGGAVAFLGASIVSGIELLLDLAHFHTAVPTAQLVITGEGSLDLQSLAGKAPWGVAKASAHAGVPVVALVGRSALEDEEARAAGFAEVHTLTHLEPDRERCHREASALLVLLARRLAQTSPLFGAAGAAPADSAKS